ncbi:MAG: dihydrofolate reductase [Clostridiales Family XIII bacterium]|nr:dihydrofolate reductase [Clostridiales Family XIII bacterium]
MKNDEQNPMRELTKSDVRLIAIASVDRDWGIGKGGKLLAHLPGDLRYFKAATLGQIVVMGRRTLESLPGGRPLRDRTTLVLTRRADFEANGAATVRSVEELAREIAGLRAKGGMKAGERTDVFAAGGGDVYAELLPYTEICLITKMEESFAADAFFPNLDEDEEFLLARSDAPITENGLTYRFTEYRRR